MNTPFLFLHHISKLLIIIVFFDTEIFLAPILSNLTSRTWAHVGLHHQLSSDQNVPNVVYGCGWSGGGGGDGILMLACIWRQSVIQFTMARYNRPH